MRLSAEQTDFVKTIRARSRELGIRTADSYLREFEACLDGACPSNILKNISHQGWQRLMKRASRTVVYDGRGLEFGETVRIKEGLTGGIELPPRTLATIPVIVTTPTRDRDGDILETAGADFDLKSAHLFNHLPSEVVGTTIKQLAHTKKVLKVLLSIMDTQFAENVAVMYEHGSLRTSHGFLPTKWEAIDDGEGYHILEFKILEVSGVSIPSNPDAGPAGAMEFSRHKLTHPLLKEWGRMKFRERPVQIAAGIDLSSLPAGTTITLGGDKPQTAEKDCTCHTDHESAKGAFQLDTKSVVPFSNAPVSDKAWDASGAVKRGQAWSSVDEEDPPASAWKKFRKIFAIQDGDADKIGSYKFPYHDVEDGKLVLVPKGVTAAIGALNGARGGTKISEEDRKGAYGVLVKAYKKCYPDQDPPELKSFDTKGLYLDLDGSWDRIRDDLAETVKAYLISGGCAGPADWVYIAAMFPDHALVCVMEDALAPGECSPLWDDSNACYYEVEWRMEDGKAVWDGEVKEVEVSVDVSEATERAFTVEQKAAEKIAEEKAAVTAGHVAKLAKAMSHLKDAGDHDDATGKITGIANKGHAAVKSVHDAHDKGIFTSANQKALEKAMGYCSTGAEHDDATAPIAKSFKAAGRCIKDVMDDAGSMGESSTESTEKAGEAKPAEATPETKTVETETKGLTLGPEHTRKATAALYHFKAIEHHDEAGNEHVELARKGSIPLQDMLNQVDSDAADAAYEEGRGEPDDKAAKIGKANMGRVNTAIEHGEALAKHKSATPHVKAMAKHAVAHLKAIVKPADPAGEAGENGDEGTEGTNGNPPKSFEECCEALYDEAETKRAEDDGDSLVTLAAVGSRAGKLAQKHFARQADCNGK